MTTDSKIYSKSWLLTPGECNCEKEMPVWLMTERIIDVATEHANSWGVGYARLILDNQAWVLSRVAIEMKRWPKVNETYTLSTWVEDYNRHFSERNIEVTDTDGNVIGHAHTVWVVIDLTTRQSCDISSLDYIRNNLCEKECPIAKHTRIRSVDAARTSEYTFQYSDIDFNQHVNSLRYIRLLLDQWTADFHNEHVVKRFEIAYMNEGLPEQTVQISVDDRSDDCTLEISHGSEPLCRTRIVFDNR